MTNNNAAYPCVIKPKVSDKYLKDMQNRWVVKLMHNETDWDYFTFESRKRAMEFYETAKWKYSQPERGQ